MRAISSMMLIFSAISFIAATVLVTASPLTRASSAALAAIGPVPRIQEFFAGSGNLTALCLGHAPVVRTVERDADAVARALKGARLYVVTAGADSSVFQFNFEEKTPSSLFDLSPKPEKNP